MSLLRYDPTTNDWVIFAPSRARRPHEFRGACLKSTPEAAGKACPFCPGNEKLTPPEIIRVPTWGLPKSADWRVRVIPNMFPDRKSTRLNSSHERRSRMPSSA